MFYKDYITAFNAAQVAADCDGFDRGIEFNSLLGQYRVFPLPAKKSRTGFERKCEVVSCSEWCRIQPGHGPS